MCNLFYKGVDNLTKKPEIMVLGTFHFQGSVDVIQSNVGNLMTAEKQQEINHVVDKLVAFNPTQIAVEIEKVHNEKLNKSYQDYKNNSFDLTVNEVHQLGFKIGKKLNLETISAVDWMENINNRSIDDVFKWAQANQSDLYDKIISEYISKLEIDFHGLTVLEILKRLNKGEKQVPLDHELYMLIARIGKGNDYVGIDWVRWWYQRNLIIFKNILDLIHDENERILVIIGVGHRYLINQFLSESNEVTIVNPNTFLEM